MRRPLLAQPNRRLALAALVAGVVVGCTPMGLPPEPRPTAPPAPPVAQPTPPAANAALPVRTVADIVRVADTDARALLDAPARVRAQVVGSVNGEGCSDFVMLVDPEDAAAYQKIFDPSSSDAEFQRARAVPMLMAGPTRDFPAGVLDQPIAVYQGRFARCDGALRFVIESTVPTGTAPRSR